MSLHLKLLEFCKNVHYSLLIIGLCNASAYSAEPVEKAIMELIVNGHSEGQQFLSFSGENDVVVAKKLLKSLHIKNEILDAIPGESVHLNQLPELSFKLDTSKAILHLTISADWFEAQTIKQEITPPASNRKMIAPAPVSAYLNYQLQNSFSDARGLETINVPLEVGINAGQWFAFSNFAVNYSNTGNQKVSLQRQMTNLTWDDIPNMRTLVLGDFNPPTQPLMSSFTLGGISWGTKFSVNRQFRAYPNLDIEAMIDSASHAQLISNGQVVREWDVTPGRALFSNIGSNVGNDAELLLTDAYGGQRRLRIPTLISNQLLKADLHEYNYSLGFIKNQTYPFNNFSYAHPLFSGHHRYGITNELTAGLALATDGSKTLISPSINAALGDYHKFNLAGSASLGKKHTHYAGSASYQYNWQNLFGYAAFNFYGRGYDNSFVANTFSNIFPTSLNRHYQTTIGIGYNQTDLGSFNANYSETVGENQKTERFVSLNYQKQIFSGLNITLSARENIGSLNDYSTLLGLQYYPAKPEQREFFDALTYQIAKANKQPMQQELMLQKYNTRGLGFGYNVNIKNDSDKNNAFGNIRTQYNHEKGILTTNYSRAKTGENQGGVSLAGSVALVDGGVYTGRPVSDSFALVKTGRANIPVELYNTVNGYSNDKGELLVPELSSYSENRVNLAANTLTINDSVDHNEQYVEVKQRGSGSVVTFNIQKFTAIDGNLTLLTADNKAEPLESVPIEIVTQDKKYESALGKDGYFYLENIPTGEHTLTVLLYKGNCSTQIKVLETAKIVQNLGSLTCKVNPVSATDKVLPGKTIISPSEKADTENNVTTEEDQITTIKSATEKNSISELQKEKTYTIQLMASENQVDITRFISKYKNTASLALFNKLKNGKKLFVVIYGAYSTDGEAKEALKKLPEELKKNDPWIIKLRNP